MVYFSYYSKGMLVKEPASTVRNLFCLNALKWEGKNWDTSFRNRFRVYWRILTRLRVNLWPLELSNFGCLSFKGQETLQCVSGWFSFGSGQMTWSKEVFSKKKKKVRKKETVLRCQKKCYQGGLRNDTAQMKKVSRWRGGQSYTYTHRVTEPDSVSSFF